MKHSTRPPAWGLHTPLLKAQLHAAEGGAVDVCAHARVRVGVHVVVRGSEHAPTQTQHPATKPPAPHYQHGMPPHPTLAHLVVGGSGSGRASDRRLYVLTLADPSLLMLPMMARAGAIWPCAHRGAVAHA